MSRGGNLVFVDTEKPLYRLLRDSIPNGIALYRGRDPKWRHRRGEPYFPKRYGTTTEVKRGEAYMTRAGYTAADYAVEGRKSRIRRDYPTAFQRKKQAVNFFGAGFTKPNLGGAMRRRRTKKRGGFLPLLASVAGPAIGSWLIPKAIHALTGRGIVRDLRMLPKRLSMAATSARMMREAGESIPSALRMGVKVFRGVGGPVRSRLGSGPLVRRGGLIRLPGGVIRVP